MTIALTRVTANAIPFKGPTRKRGIQVLEIEFTAAATDVDLDIGDRDGTFWTAVDKAAVLAKIENVLANCNSFLCVKSPQLADRLQTAAAGGNGEFALAIEDKLPNLTVNAADGETAWELHIELSMKRDKYPVGAEIYG